MKQMCQIFKFWKLVSGVHRQYFKEASAQKQRKGCSSDAELTFSSVCISLLLYYTVQTLYSIFYSPQNLSALSHFQKNI